MVSRSSTGRLQGIEIELPFKVRLPAQVEGSRIYAPIQAQLPIPPVLSKGPPSVCSLGSTASMMVTCELSGSRLELVEDT